MDCGNYINSAQTALKLAEKAVGENIHDNFSFANVYWFSTWL